MSTRYAFIQFPNFCHQHTKRLQQIPLFVLVKESHKTFFVSDLGVDEYQMGLNLGMPLAHAKAIAPNLITYPHHDEEFIIAFSSLAQQALRFSPHVAIDGFGLLINISGCAHLFGGEASLLKAIDDFFRGLGFYTEKAIAPHPLLAKALAHWASNSINNGPKKSAIEPLPIEALFIEDSILSALHTLGITTMKDLLKLPRRMLAQRFGLPLLEKIDQLHGVIHQPPVYIKEAREFSIKEDLTSPIRTHDYFIEALSDLLAKILDQIQTHHRSLQGFMLHLTDIFKKTVSITIAASKPHNRLELWLDLVRLKTENLDLKEGINTIALVVTHSPWTKSLQRNLAQKDDVAEGELLHMTDRLKSRLGQEAIFHRRIVEKHLPERAIAKDISLKQETSSCLKLPPRPLRLLSNPIPISVIALLPDNPPAAILWKNHIIKVLHANGPERIEDEWWSPAQEPPRDYFYIEDEQGKRLWIYSIGEPKQWFVHGIFA